MADLSLGALIGDDPDRPRVNPGAQIARHHIENLCAALAISIQHGNRGVALLVDGDTRYAAVDQSDQWAGHTALLLLLQEIPSVPNKPSIYVIGDLSEADLGVFLPQVKWFAERRIYCWKNSHLIVYNPAMQDRWRKDSETGLKLTPALAVLLSAPPFTGVSLFALLQPTLLECHRELDFSVLEAPAQRVFDSMFLSLCASLLTRSKDKGQGPSIGAVIVNRYGEILSYGNDMSTELHAETVTIKKLQGAEGHMPDMEGCRFYTSLEPCMMCSGFIYESCVNNPQHRNPKNFKVVYLQWDPAVHLIEVGKQKFTATTVLEERGLYDLASQEHIIQRLEEKRLKLHQLHNANPTVVKKVLKLDVSDKNTNYVRRFEKSAVKAVEYPTYRRRFAKMKLRLLSMPALITMVCENNLPAQRFLLGIWVNILRFLAVDCGQNCAEEMRLVAEFLNNTRATNLLRADEEGYSTRERADFMAFYKKFVENCQVFHV